MESVTRQRRLAKVQEEFNNALKNINVRKLTEVVISLARLKFDLNKQLDNDMFNHIVYVCNQILQLAKKEGISWETTEKAGKMLWRLYLVIVAYNGKRQDVTLSRILSIVEDFHSTFNGV